MAAAAKAVVPAATATVARVDRTRRRRRRHHHHLAALLSAIVRELDVAGQFRWTVTQSGRGGSAASAAGRCVPPASPRLAERWQVWRRWLRWQGRISRPSIRPCRVQLSRVRREPPRACLRACIPRRGVPQIVHFLPTPMRTRRTPPPTHAQPRVRIRFIASSVVGASMPWWLEGSSGVCSDTVPCGIPCREGPFGWQVRAVHAAIP